MAEADYKPLAFDTGRNGEHHVRGRVDRVLEDEEGAAGDGGEVDGGAEAQARTAIRTALALFGKLPQA